MSDGGTLTVGSTRGKIYIYDLRSGSSPVNTTVAHKTSVQSLSFQSSTKVNSLANNKSSKPALPTSKPTTLPVSSEQSASKQPDHTVHTPVSKQNGLKDDDALDIFSPLREIKTPSVINNKQSTLPGSEEVCLSTNNFKENNPPDGSGIFSPIGSNLSAAASSQLHHPVGVTQNSPRTLGVTTVTGPPALQNVRSSSARSLTDLNTAQELDTSTKPSSDSTLGVSLAPSSPGSQSKGNQRKGSSEEYNYDSDGTAGSLHAEVDGRQANSGSPPGSARNGNRVLQTENTIRPGQGSLHGSPAQLRKSADGRIPDLFIGQATTAVTAGETVSPGQSLIFDNVKHSPDPLPSGAVGMATPVPDVAVTSNAGLLPFQVQFIKNLIDESLDEFRVALHRDIVNVQVEMLRQFQIQQNELKGMLEKYSVNEALVTEIERLKDENNRLKSKY
ncbi:Protein nedd1 [Desmophyllum pertusum]|uniref:Protein nedd1 n=1 Tax=Desmophyllum pertusum TaxID=174260 RepID=A0A9W9YNF3_9CNID|nr:Protein nedd1 [Desmophyllum pertusum]